MSNPISSVAHSQTVAQAPAAPPKPPAAKSQSSPAASVKISNAATAALQEAMETQAQTTREANGGDGQARRLLAKESAAAKTGKS